MIERYTRPQMAAIWSLSHRYQLWFQLEYHAAVKMADLGVIPATVPAALAKVADLPYTKERIARIEAIEAETRHDVIAFLSEIAEQVGEEARFLHQGLTSSDILDSCLALQLKQAGELLLADLDGLLAALAARAHEYKYTPTIGRSHGIHAEPTSFGLKLAYHYAGFTRARQRLEAAIADIACGAISGAVGTFANVSPEVEAYVCKIMGLAIEPISTQIIARDHHAHFFAVLGVIASQLEALAIEIRHLQRSEVAEAEEYFAAGQKGSSAMPHKRNPVLSENLTGLARLVRSAVMPALENVALWHERDISHSSVERGIGPDATVHLDFALVRATGLIHKLVVYPEAMQKNLDSQQGLYHSQRVMLALTQAGVGREDAYRMVQRVAMEAWQHKRDFRQALLADQPIRSYLDEAAIISFTELAYHLKEVDTIFARVFPKG